LCNDDGAAIGAAPAGRQTTPRPRHGSGEKFARDIHYAFSIPLADHTVAV
jgi:hypothetical protein